MTIRMIRVLLYEAETSEDMRKGMKGTIVDAAGQQFGPYFVKEVGLLEYTGGDLAFKVEADGAVSFIASDMAGPQHSEPIPPPAPPTEDDPDLDPTREPGSLP